MTFSSGVTLWLLFSLSYFALVECVTAIAAMIAAMKQKENGGITLECTRPSTERHDNYLEI